MNFFYHYYKPVSQSQCCILDLDKHMHRQNMKRKKPAELPASCRYEILISDVKHVTELNHQNIVTVITEQIPDILS